MELDGPDGQALYQKLRRLAAQLMRAERVGHTLQPTDLVHEALLKLARRPDFSSFDSVSLRALIAKAMREVLIDHARRVRTRESRRKRVTLVDEVALTDVPAVDVLTVDDLLARLSRIRPRWCEFIVLRFFGGLTVEEAAAVLRISRATAERVWRLARSWFRRELARGREHELGSG